MILLRLSQLKYGTLAPYLYDARNTNSSQNFLVDCSTQPSVACMVYPMVGGDSKQNFYWGHKEILVPVYKKMEDAMRKHPEADVMVNFASLRSAYDSTLEAMNYPQIREGPDSI